MADEPIIAHAHAVPVRAKSDRGILGLVGVVLVLVVVALAVLLFGGFDTNAGQRSASGGAKEIVPVAGMTADTGVISVWVANSDDISTVLRIAGLEDSTATNMGGGRYVISVPPGTEQSVVGILAGMEGVHDAGLVYSETE